MPLLFILWRLHKIEMCTSARWRNYIYKTLCFDSFDSFPPLLSMAALSVEHLKVRVYLLGGGVSMAALTVEHLKVRVYLLPLSNK